MPRPRSLRGGGVLALAVSCVCRRVLCAVDALPCLIVQLCGDAGQWTIVGLGDVPSRCRIVAVGAALAGEVVCLRHCLCGCVAM